MVFNALTIAERTNAAGLRLLRRAGGLRGMDNPAVRKTVERLITQGTATGFRSATAAASLATRVNKRAFPRKKKAGDPTRSRQVKRDVFDLTPTEDQAMIQQACRELADEVLRPAAAEADDSRSVPLQVQAAAEQIGLHLLGIPPELGGIAEEASAVTGVLALEQLARGDMGLTTALMAPTSVATALSLYADATQQETFLAAFTGEQPPRAAIALMEPQPLFDALSLQTCGRGDGADLILDGVKALVPGAADAELFIVGAMVGGVPRLLIVEGNRPGITVEDDPAMGIRAAATGRVTFRGVRVPKSNLLGSADDYPDAVRRSRLAWSAMAVGTAQACLDQLIPYVKERQAFGEPIAYRQAVAFTISDIAIELDGMRLLMWRAAARLDAGKDAAADIAQVRTLVSTYATQIGSNAVQLLGGHGFVKEWGNERWYRDLRGAGLLDGGLIV